MIERLADALRVLRPRALAHTRKRVDDLGDAIGGVRQEIRQLQMAQREAHDQQMAHLAQLGERIRRQEAGHLQLRALLARDIQQEGNLASLDAVVNDTSSREYIRGRIAAASFEEHPFPYLVADDVLPRPLYDALIKGLPPVELFNDHPPNRQQLTVPFAMAPAYARRIWSHMVDAVVPTMVMPALLERFGAAMDRWVREQFPEAGVGLDGVKMVPSDGRLLLRTRGYVIPPHRDPKWGFVTCILYLARRGDSPSWGTQLYEIEGDRDARGTLPHWIAGQACRMVKDVEFIPNRALVFMNSTGAHGASIPADAPEGLERYIYQFRLGPNTDSKARLTNSLPADRREFWAARATDE